MFTEQKHMYEELAQKIDGWKKINKNDLCRTYTSGELSDEMKNAYLAAIILNYWDKMGKLYLDTSYCATQGDCYNWVIDGVLYALKKHKWTDENNKLYKDPNGPDKVINRKIKHLRSNHIKAENRDKRKINLGTESLERLREDYGFDVEGQETTEKIENNYITDFIRDSFNKKDYLVAFMLDGVLNFNCYDFIEGAHIFNSKRLARQLKEVTDSYLEIFANSYDLDLDDVKIGISYVKRMPSDVRKQKIEDALFNLRHIFRREDLEDAI